MNFLKRVIIKKWGAKTLELKSEIENGIKEKFNEISDVLDDLDWSEDNLYQEGKNERYIFYTMLKKEFTFEKEFTKLENAKFKNIEDVKFFGIDSTSDNQLRNQVYVYFYESNKKFAVKLLTNENEEVILSRGVEGDTFLEMYNNIIKLEKKYKGSHRFATQDTLKVPNIKFDLKKEYKELEQKEFCTKYKEVAKIEKALQTIKLELDEKGGKIKSEAVMDVVLKSAVMQEEKRNFIFDDEFSMFLKENNKKLPYFAGNINDIKLFQE